MHARARHRGRKRRLLWAAALTGLLFCIVAATAAGAWALDGFGRTPREIAVYIERRALGHRPSIVEATRMVATYLMTADRPEWHEVTPLPEFGASAAASGTPTPSPVHRVTDVAGLRAAVGNAMAGDTIELAPGTYHVPYPAVLLNRPGTAEAPITLRAARLGEAVIEADNTETLRVMAPYWHIENLVMHGTCGEICDNGIHVVGAAHDTLIRNNRIYDLNAQIKINGEEGKFPDNGQIIGNTLTQSEPRNVTASVSAIDLVAASGWRIADNLIVDIGKSGGDQVAYGAYAKGAGSHNLFENNMILCSASRPGTGLQVGLSLGGGGTEDPYRRDLGKTGIEQTGSTLRGNLIAFCSDAGIYINRAADSHVENNTLIDTVGIDVRFIESSAIIDNNVIDGATRTRDGGTMHGSGNVLTPLPLLFLGWHPIRALFQAPASLDLRWRGNPPEAQPIATPARDLCGNARKDVARPGAFEDFTPCSSRAGR